MEEIQSIQPMGQPVDLHLEGRLPNASSRVSIHHALGFNWHPFEGAGIHIHNMKH